MNGSKAAHPKVIAATGSAGVVAAILALVNGIHVSKPVAALIAAVAAFIGGYLRSS